MRKINSRGFTLIELLIVIAIIAILAAVVFVALDPLRRFRDSRDARRWSDISELLNAIKVDQVDNGGNYITAVRNLTPGTHYMIVDGNVVAGCDNQNANCDVAVTADDSCADLSGLVTEGYIGDVPISPSGNGTWSSSITGYVLTATSTGALTIDACESENASEITVTR